MIKKVFILSVVVVVVYSLYLAAVPHYRYVAFKSDLKEILRVSVVETPEEVLTKIYNLVEEYKIPVKEEDIELIMDKEYIAILSWQETVNFFNVYQRTFKFYIDTSE